MADSRVMMLRPELCFQGPTARASSGQSDGGEPAGAREPRLALKHRLALARSRFSPGAQPTFLAPSLSPGSPRMAAPTAAPLRQTLLRNPSSDSSFTSLSSATSDYTASTSSSSQLGTSYTSNASSTHKGGILRPAQAPSPGPPAAGDAGRPAPGGATPDEAGAPSSSVPSSSRPCSSISFAPLPPIPIRRRASIAVGVAARGQLLRSQAGCGGGSSKQRSQGVRPPFLLPTALAPTSLSSPARAIV